MCLPQERGRGGYALVVSTENITQNWYHGIERSMLIPNTIFRMGSGGGAACNVCALVHPAQSDSWLTWAGNTSSCL